MRKNIFLILILLSAGRIAFAEDETLTITTYYPSPHGSYNQVEVYRSVVYKPLSTAPTTNLQEGELVYIDSDSTDTTPGEFSYYGGGRWNPQTSNGDTPPGAVMYFNLPSCPTGWTELLDAQGRYLVGLPSGGTRGKTVGTALTDLENRPVGQHTHTITDPGHSHTYTRLDNEKVIDAGKNERRSKTANPETSISVTGITINNAGTIAGTNAPYLQLLVCQKEGGNIITNAKTGKNCKTYCLEKRGSSCESVGLNIFANDNRVKGKNCVTGIEETAIHANCDVNIDGCQLGDSFAPFFIYCKCKE